jgi:hypothetical protein
MATSTPERGARCASIPAAFVLALGAQAALAGDPADPLADRPEGIPTSLLGTYIRPRELLVYPFFEYTRHNKFEYKPGELGVSGPGSEDEFKGKTVEREYLLFLAYAFSDSLALEFESALHSSLEFTRAGDDRTGTPDKLRESGLGDTEINLRWRYARETARRPDITFFMKTVFPLQKSKKLLGSRDWEFEPGVVLTKDYSFGTLAARGAISYSSGDRKFDFAEWGIDYLKRLSPNWRLALSVEGHQVDEIAVIGELQYALRRNAVLKLNMGIGLTEKAPSIAPEIGILFRF